MIMDKRLRYIAISGMWATTLMMFILLALSSNNGWKITLYTNAFGEGPFELLAVYFVLVLGLPVLVENFREAFK